MQTPDGKYILMRRELTGVWVIHYGPCSLESAKIVKSGAKIIPYHVDGFGGRYPHHRQKGEIYDYYLYKICLVKTANKILEKERQKVIAAKKKEKQEHIRYLETYIQKMVENTNKGYHVIQNANGSRSMIPAQTISKRKLEIIIKRETKKVLKLHGFMPM
jgi:hypothetical protein